MTTIGDVECHVGYKSCVTLTTNSVVSVLHVSLFQPDLRNTNTGSQHCNGRFFEDIIIEIV